jgi:hypothetical protein
MGFFKLLMAVCDDLTRMIQNFWWGSREGKRKTHWKGWEELLKPKACGCMGYRDFRCFKHALLAWQAWRLISDPGSLCARVLKAMYYLHRQLQDMVFAGNASSTWQAILHGLELLKKCLIWRIGNGQQVPVWRDPWIPQPFSYRPLSTQGECRIRRVSGLLDNVLGTWSYCIGILFRRMSS